jgi:hypothetical protein
MARKMREWPTSERKIAQTSAKAWQDFFARSAAAEAVEARELEAVARVVEARQLHELELLALDGVVGVAEGYKVNRDRGEPRGSSPPTPPYVRVPYTAVRQIKQHVWVPR